MTSILYAKIVSVEALVEQRPNGADFYERKEHRKKGTVLCQDEYYWDDSVSIHP